MKMNLVEKVRNSIQNASDTILLIKATGGYSFRKQIPLPDLEIEKRLVSCEETFVDYVVRCVVAEHLLAEPCPSYHDRWDEYQSRLNDVVREVAESEKAEEKKKHSRILVFRRR